MAKKAVILIGVLFMLSDFVFSQNATTVTFTGFVFDRNDSTTSLTAIVVNKRTGMGHTYLPDAQFSVSGERADTFIVTSGGFEMMKFCFKDSSSAITTFSMNVYLKMKVNALAPVTVYSPPDLEQLRKSREVLGVQRTTTTSGMADAVNSPITYLYERFSREGKSRALVARLENEDKKREVLTGLLHLYVMVGLIDLKQEEFEQFITYLNIPDEMLKTYTDYQLAVYIKGRFLQYRGATQIHRDNQR
jgi:hypothetical protein